jgi:outer membrane protein assembly factor BamB
VEAAACALRDGSHAVVGAHDGGVSFLRLSDGALTWRYAAAGAVKAPLAVDAWRGAAWGASHGRDAFALCVRARTAMWTHRLDGAVSAAPALDARRRRVYFATLAGSVYAIDDARSGDDAHHDAAPHEAWRVSVGAAVFGAPAVVPRTGGVLVAGADGAVTCLAARDGARLWALPLPGGGRVTAAAAVDAAPPAWWRCHHPNSVLLAVATTAGDVFVIETPQLCADDDASAAASVVLPLIVAAA